MAHAIDWLIDMTDDEIRARLFPIGPHLSVFSTAYHVQCKVALVPWNDEAGSVLAGLGPYITDSKNVMRNCDGCRFRIHGSWRGVIRLTISACIYQLDSCTTTYISTSLSWYVYRTGCMIKLRETARSRATEKTGQVKDGEKKWWKTLDRCATGVATCVWFWFRCYAPV